MSRSSTLFFQSWSVGALEMTKLDNKALDSLRFGGFSMLVWRPRRITHKETISFGGLSCRSETWTAEIYCWWPLSENLGIDDGRPFPGLAAEKASNFVTRFMHSRILVSTVSIRPNPISPGLEPWFLLDGHVLSRLQIVWISEDNTNMW